VNQQGINLTWLAADNQQLNCQLNHLPSQVFHQLSQHNLTARQNLEHRQHGICSAATAK